MTDLSPAAQAVLDAAFPVYDEDEHLYVVSGEQHAAMIAAAALRAAAEHLHTTSPWPGHIESTGVNWSRNELLAIAAELEVTA
jgi:hypothetical protein